MTSLFSHSYEERWLLALLCGKISMRPMRLTAIQSSYLSLLQAFEDHFSAFDVKDHTWVKKLRSFNWVEEYHLLQQNCEKHNIQIVTVLDQHYPTNLNILEDQPLVLYFQGNIELLQQTSEMVTVVGSRNFSRYSEMVMKHILVPACSRGVGVVSGLALGIDGLSHQIALESGAATIAVIGSGIDTVSFYPTQNIPLARQIVESNGLILSEYQPGTKATQFNFPRRNRILAALTSLTWVVQAGIKSGTLITAKLAQELGKHVAVTPGSILESSMAGSLQLLKDGAQIISESDDILSLLGFSALPFTQVERLKNFSSFEEQQVYETLSLTPRLADTIGQQLGVEIYTLSMHLTMLEMNGLAVNVGENLWVRGF